VGFREQKLVFVEQLEPGLQFFPSESEFQAAYQRDIEERSHRSAFSQVAPIFLAAAAAIPFVGPAISAAGKAYLSGEQSEQAAREAQSRAAISAIAASHQEQPIMNGDESPFESILTTGADLLTRLLTIKQQQSVPAALQVSAPGVFGAALPALPALGSLLGRALPLIGGAVSAAAGVIRSAAGRIVGVMLATGKRISTPAAVSLARTMGIQAAATALGIGAVELAEMIFQEEQRKMRRRSAGVTAAQMRTTRRTMRKVEGLHNQIVQAAKDAGHHHHHRRR